MWTVKDIGTSEVEEIDSSSLQEAPRSLKRKQNPAGKQKKPSKGKKNFEDFKVEDDEEADFEPREEKRGKKEKNKKRKREIQDEGDEYQDQDFEVEDGSGYSAKPSPTDGWGWKSVEIDHEFMGMEGFLGLEELDGEDFELIANKAKAKQEKVSLKDKKKMKKTHGVEKTGDSEAAEAEAETAEDDQETNFKPKERSKKAQKKFEKLQEKKALWKEAKLKAREQKAQEEATKTTQEVAGAGESEDFGANADEERLKGLNSKADNLSSQLPDVDISAWLAHGLHQNLLNALQFNKFTEPTEIQQKCLKVAIEEKRDVVGSAETGSGKTLAFGLPMLNYLAKREEFYPSFEVKKQKTRLTGLILAPTRELAIQVKDHLVSAARFTTISVIALVGGVSVEKQHRLLSYSPDIIVATPGRFWELVSSSDAPYLRDMTQLKFLVLDEADRMIEEGHFKELDDIIDLVKKGSYGKPENDSDYLATVLGDEEEAERVIAKNEKKKKLKSKLQIFLFSATLSVKEEFKKQVKGKKSRHTGTLRSLIERINFPEPGPVIVDVSKEGVMAEKITETRIFCPLEEKDSYVFYFLNRYPGRSIVFVNSIDAIRRLLSVLLLLGVDCGGLHAQMQQRQRLKNLDRFKEKNNYVLVATDVAARGLDIPDVQHVIHYQIPRSPEIYIHRAGRTARARKHGLSLMLVAADEMEPYKKICKILGKEEGIPEFPVEMSFLPAIRKRAKLAARIDKEEHMIKKKNNNIDWFQKNAKALEIDLDEDIIKTTTTSDRHLQDSIKRIADMREELRKLLQQTILPMGNSARYITSGLIRNLPEKFREAEGHGKNLVPNDTKSTAIDATIEKHKNKPQRKKVVS